MKGYMERCRPWKATLEGLHEKRDLLVVIFWKINWAVSFTNCSSDSWRNPFRFSKEPKSSFENKLGKTALDKKLNFIKMELLNFQIDDDTFLNVPRLLELYKSSKLSNQVDFIIYFISKISNKSTLASLLVSAYSFGIPSLRLPQDLIKILLFIIKHRHF